ncbi:MAG: acylneuraminate cytidylyltransferase family protein [Bacillota bacterium]|nr:acylneuraminate cytidylyltransferase family protein [Bacillota bacterium]
MAVLAIIPARSGSKGIRDKNIKLLAGKPLLAYSIVAAIQSGVFDEVMVSTDSRSYAEIAEKFGAKVPFLRSAKTSTDQASTRESVLEVHANYLKMNKFYDEFMILQPTSPLRTHQDIMNAYNLFKRKEAKSVISVCEVDHSPHWANTLDETLSLKGFISQNMLMVRQSLERFYRLNGAIYLHDTKYYLENAYCFDETSFAYIMDKMNSVDIDDMFDFYMAEFFIKKHRESLT